MARTTGGRGYDVERVVNAHNRIGGITRVRKKLKVWRLQNDARKIEVWEKKRDYELKASRKCQWERNFEEGVSRKTNQVTGTQITG